MKTTSTNMCGTDSAMESERLKIEDVLASAHPNSNVVILNRLPDDDDTEKFDAVFEALGKHVWRFNDEFEPDENSYGPECHLCGQEIWDISDPLTFNGTI